MTPALALVAMLIAAGLLLEVELPWGGKVPLGHALVIAVTVLLAPVAAVLTVGAALVLALPFRHRRLVELGVVAAGSAMAAVAQSALSLMAGHRLGVDATIDDLRVLLEIAVTGGAFLAVDFVLRRRPIAQVWTLYLTLLCAAALLAVAYRHSPALSVVAIIPLLVTRYSFERFSSARQAYSQTTQALSLLPEVAGLTRLGHGERTAIYASALAAELGFDRATCGRIASAARLHHIGYISLHEPEERTEDPDAAALGRVSADLLRETGFLADLADLVEQAQDGLAGARQLEAAVIRVCSTLDDLAERDRERAEAGDPLAEAFTEPFIGVLRHHHDGLERTAAIALLRLHDRRPDLVADAHASSQILAAVASGDAAG